MIIAKIFKREKTLQDIGQIIGWWELRRLVFNLVVGVTGIITVIIIFLICWRDVNITGQLQFKLLPSPPILLIPCIFIYAVCANVCYATGWMAEIIVKKIWKEKADYFGEIAFALGLVFSVIVTLIPAGFATAVALSNKGPHCVMKRAPTVAEVVGVYHLTEPSRRFAENAGGYVITGIPQLEFKEDETFRMTNIPDWWLQYSKPNRLLDSGLGEWRICGNMPWRSIELDFKEINGKPQSLTTTIGFYRPNKIVLILGDPDSGYTMEFEKR